MQKLRSTSRLSRHSGFGWEALVCAALATTLLTASIAASDGPPKLKLGQSCEAAARGAITAGRDKEACMADERTAQDQVTKTWSKYATADKTDCVGMNTTGGPPSYVELLTCLEIMRDAKTIRKDLSLHKTLFGEEAADDRG